MAVMKGKAWDPKERIEPEEVESWEISIGIRSNMLNLIKISPYLYKAIIFHQDGNKFKMEGKSLYPG